LVVVLTVIRLLIAPYLTSTPNHKRGGLYAACRILNESLDAIVYAGVFVFLIIRPFGIQMFQIPTGSMLETLQINDFIVANKAVYRYSDPKVGDIVVFRPPNGAIQDTSYIDPDGQVNQDYIKRCVGVPGDLVEVKDGKLWRNGKAIEEPYLSDAAKPIDNYYKLVHYTGPNATESTPFSTTPTFPSTRRALHHAPLPPRQRRQTGGVTIGFNFVIAYRSIEVMPDGSRQINAKEDDERTLQKSTSTTSSARPLRPAFRRLLPDDG